MMPSSSSSSSAAAGKMVVWNGVAVVEDKRYPAPLASHDAVVQHPSLFWDTLRRFHSMLGTKFMVPVIGGKELDLHVLYAEVTRRGGYDQVVVEKKWREVGCVFRFSPTTTSASYVLRKHYQNLLYHYEQVYFLKLQGPLFPPPAVTLPVNRCSYDGSEAVQCSSQTTTDSLSEGIGTIDAKIDCGYLVSVRLGSETLNGVLYHPERPLSPESTIETSNAIVPYTPVAYPLGRRNRRRKQRDPNHPKPNRSGYNFFFAQKHAALKSTHPNREREFTKMIGEAWSKLSQEERLVYQNIGLEDKERYRVELKEYKERLGQSAGLPRGDS